MFAYILKRLLLMIPTLFGVLLLTFAIIQFVPGGPVEQLAAELKGTAVGEAGGVLSRTYRGDTGMDKERMDELRRLYGFDQPATERFGMMVKRFLTFDLGESYHHHKSVGQLIREKLPVSISLGLWSLLISYLVSIPLGIRKAVRDGSQFDIGTTALVLVGNAIPGFVLGVVLIVLFGGGSFWSLFPLRGLVSDNWASLDWPARIADYLWHMVLPVTAMVVSQFAVLTILTKNSFLDEIRRQYVLTARAKGVTERAVLYRHVFRNAMIPLATGFPAAFIAAFLSGSLLIETIFSLDGLGLLSFESVMKRDYPVVMGSLYLYTLLSLVGKLVADLSYVLIDPRIQFEAAE